MAYSLIVGLVLFASAFATAQKPRLVVVVSFDQYRGDYPDRFARFVSTRGFARIASEGASFASCYFNMAATITGPGHATLLTGCNSARTGIVGNDFCDNVSDECMYCVEDSAGNLGPRNLLIRTLGDVMRESNPKSKVIGLAHKDRSAVLMAGHSVTACVWLDPKSMDWETSSIYKRPRWLSSLNRRVRMDSYANCTWTASIPETQQPAADTIVGEGTYPGGTYFFPHRLGSPNNPHFSKQMLISPFSMDMLFSAASNVIKSENLGKDDNTDLLCLGVSTTDYVGHVFGPDSREVEELYVHADRLIGDLIQTLDKRVGRKRYVLVITSDHGVAPIPEVVKGLSKQQHAEVDAGRIHKIELRGLVERALTARFGEPTGGSWVREIHVPNLYLSRKATGALSMETVQNEAALALRTHKGLAFVATGTELVRGKCPQNTDSSTCHLVLQSVHTERVGDVVIYPKRYWIFGANQTSHGTMHDYDRWVPLMFIGAGIKPGKYKLDVTPADIAPTLAKMLGLDLGDVDGTAIQLRQPGFAR